MTNEKAMPAAMALTETRPDGGATIERSDFIRATVSVWLGTTMEYVDFALYGLAAGLVFGDLFFPGTDPAIALLSGFATYAVGFLARPVGAVVLGRLGDKHGRKAVLVATIILMGGSTTLIGALPTFGQVGLLAPALLVFLRICQGFGAGAELSGGAIMLAESSPSRIRGFLSAFIALGSNSGTLLASGVWLLVTQLPKGDLISWGWRIPFLCSIVITLVALVIRRLMKESPVFLAERERRLEHAETAAPAQQDGRGFLARNKAFFVMLGLRIGENGPSYLAQTFVVGYVTKVLALDKSLSPTAVFVASLIGFAVIPLAGYASDRFGRRVTYRAFCVALVLFAFPAFMLMDTKNPAIVFATIVVGMALASLGIFAVQAAYGVELFGASNRYTKMATAKEVGSLLSGGTAPLFASALLVQFGHWWPIAVYFALTAGIGLVTTFFAPETRGRDLTLEGDAI
ncbi:MFS transporter [Sinomonas sp. ASV322]|uniref:MFS transporter n=1 Tax=Sinomonas sp. ASV322 TaxID=3041920 RepID=UPI0027DE3290|nr:MFS transporter [Sinomonas sp. ASV322]MDQ4502508.1 MFS transporter [Sinomonas sp. ASV322]